MLMAMLLRAQVVSLVCDDGEVEASGVMLVLASPVFKAMFETNMCEQSTMKIELPGKLKAHVELMLQFLDPVRGRALSVSSSDVDALLHLFHEYQVEPLVEECEAVLLLEGVSVARLLQARKYGLIKQHERCLTTIAASLRPFKLSERVRKRQLQLRQLHSRRPCSRAAIIDIQFHPGGFQTLRRRPCGR